MDHSLSSKMLEERGTENNIIEFMLSQALRFLWMHQLYGFHIIVIDWLQEALKHTNSQEPLLEILTQRTSGGNKEVSIFKKLQGDSDAVMFRILRMTSSGPCPDAISS